MHISGTEIQGMMAGSWCQGKEIDVAKNVTAVCINGKIWELRGSADRILMTVNPTIALTCKNVKSALERAIKMEEQGLVRVEYNQSGLSG